MLTYQFNPMPVNFAALDRANNNNYIIHIIIIITTVSVENRIDCTGEVIYLSVQVCFIVSGIQFPAYRFIPRGV